MTPDINRVMAITLRKRSGVLIIDSQAQNAPSIFGESEMALEWADSCTGPRKCLAVGPSEVTRGAETRRCGDGRTRGRGDAGTRGRGDVETRRPGTRGRGDVETRRRGDAGMGDTKLHGQEYAMEIAGKEGWFTPA